MKEKNSDEIIISSDKIRSEQEQIQFFEKCYSKFEEAINNSEENSYYYKIADSTVKIRFAGKKLTPYFTLALNHLKTEKVEFPDLTICVWDSESTSVKMPERPCSWNDFTYRGDIWGFNSKRIKTAFHWAECSVNLLDHEKNIAIYWIKNDDYIPFWSYASPFRTIIHWHMEKKGYQLLHAAAVATNKGSVLITGKGGVGKSTTALSCIKSGLGYLADDYLITSNNDMPKVYSLYNSAKLNSDQLINFQEFSELVINFNKITKEKAVMYLYPKLKEKITFSSKLKAVLVPFITNSPRTSFEPEDKWKVQKAASFTTMTQLPNVGQHTHDYICNLIDSLPVFQIKLGNNLNQIPNVIRNFIDREEYLNYENKNLAKKKLTKPLVSVVIPVFNGEDFIKKAVESVFSQNYPALEVLIVNDGSTDNTEDKINNLNYDVRYFIQKNNGPSAARNKGIMEASGDYIMFMDVDDFWPENNIELLVNEMQDNPQSDVIHGYAQVMILNPKDGSYEYVGRPQESFLYYLGAGIYRKNIFDKVGLFNPALRYGEDSDWFYRASELNIDVKRIDEVTYFARRHENNMTKGKNIQELNVFKTLKLSLERKRARKQNK